jgi:D-amino-acid dehydrogenase
MFRACSPSAFAAAFEATARLGHGTMAELDRWASEGLAFEMHHEGELHVYVDPAELRRAAADLGRHERAGFQALELRGDEARALVPELSDAVIGAIRFPDQRHVRPASLVAALVDRLRTLGAGWLDGPATGGRSLPAGGFEVRGGFGVARADAVVIAAGAWSSNVARLFGVRLPIRPGKGYSVDYVPASVALRIPLMLSEAHCVMTPLDGALRVAGTMELGGLDERISATRVRALQRAPGRYLRGWDPAASSAAPTAGLRPMAPDGLPIIGRLSGFEGLYVATGHAMLGLTLAPRTASLLAGLIVDGADPDVLRPFSPRRFGA